MRSKAIAFLMILALLLPYAHAAAATEPQATDIRLQVNGRPVDVALLVAEGRTLVPLRAVAEALGAEVGWNGETRTVSLTLGDRQVSLPIGAMTATITTAGVSSPVSLDVPALLVGGTTYVPARFVGEGLGSTVNFDGATRTVVIGGQTGGSTGSGSGAAGQLGQLPAPAAGDWQRYDVTRDGRVDEDDTKQILASLYSPTIDVNGDGRKDTGDSFALPLLLTKWDRSGDQAVSADDFISLPAIALPSPDVAAASRLAFSLYQEALPKIGADVESKLRAEWAGLNTADPKVSASLYEQAGVLALAQHNLDAAQWAFAKSWNLDANRDSALANLAFVLTQTGRHQEALVLLSRARQMNSKACATINNIGGVFARNGQNTEALNYYQEAAQTCPQIGQYHLNLGVILLRLGRDTDAAREFQEASKQIPGDREALFMMIAANPVKPGEMQQYQAQYERERAQALADTDLTEEERSGMEEYYQPWEELSGSEKAEQIVGQVQEQLDEEREEVLKSLADGYREQLDKIARTVAPGWENGCADLQKWSANWESAVEQIMAVVREANVRESLVRQEYERRKGAAVLAIGPLIMKIALTEAQIAMAQYSDGNQARQAFEETVDSIYGRAVEIGEMLLKTPYEDWQMDLEPNASDDLQAVVLTFMAIIANIGDPHYAATLDKCGAQVEGSPNIQFDSGGQVAGVSLGVVGFEWNLESNELKLQVGQGIIAAGTWSPKGGFGFQVGAGLDISEGGFKVSAAEYIKFGSDGSITGQIEGGAGLEVGIGTGWQGGASTVIRAATHEPILAWP